MTGARTVPFGGRARDLSLGFIKELALDPGLGSVRFGLAEWTKACSGRVLGGERAWEHKDLGDAEKSGGLVCWNGVQSRQSWRFEAVTRWMVRAEMPGSVGTRALGETAAAVR